MQGASIACPLASTRLSQRTRVPYRASLHSLVHISGINGSWCNECIYTTHLFMNYNVSKIVVVFQVGSHIVKVVSQIYQPSEPGLLL